MMGNQLAVGNRGTPGNNHGSGNKGKRPFKPRPHKFGNNYASKHAWDNKHDHTLIRAVLGCGTRWQTIRLARFFHWFEGARNKTGNKALRNCWLSFIASKDPRIDEETVKHGNRGYFKA
jgi:hypothetical protein